MGENLGVKSGGKTFGVKGGVRCLGESFFWGNMEDNLRAKV